MWVTFSIVMRDDELYLVWIISLVETVLKLSKLVRTMG